MLVSSKDRIKSVRQVVRAGVELLAHDIESGHPEVLSECLRAMARFHTYSFGNVLLISTQRPTATQVAGWRGWNELGRRIKQGEKGILIFAPILSEPKKETSAEGESEGEAAEPKQELLGFRPVRVFDVAQTEGEEQPQLEPVAISGDAASLLARLTDFIIKQGRSLVTRDVLLREAKAVVFVIGNALRFETEPAEKIQLYRGNLNLLAESLEVVQRISAVILGALSPEDAQTVKAVQ
jgi:hypothetical protein